MKPSPSRTFFRCSSFIPRSWRPAADTPARPARAARAGRPPDPLGHDLGAALGAAPGPEEPPRTRRYDERLAGVPGAAAAGADHATGTESARARGVGR